MAQKAEVDYIKNVLLPEWAKKFEGWNKEYTQPRDLGAKGEFVGLYRKVRKIKSIIWDGVDASNWREGLRVMLMEVIAHGFLLIYDLDSKDGQLDLSVEEETTIYVLDQSLGSQLLERRKVSGEKHGSG